MLIRMLGTLEITDASQPVTPRAGKPRRLLLMLVIRANNWVSDAELIEAIWPDGAPASAAGNVKSYVSQLRATLGRQANRIERQGGAYRLNADRDEIDSMIFEDLVERGRAATEPAQAVQLLTEALGMWRGTPFEQLDTEAAKAELTRLAELRWTARHTLAKALVDAGDSAGAIALLRAMTVDDPLREQTWHRLMTVLHGTGRRAEALAAYQEARRVLVAELGVEPGAELRELHERMLREDTVPTRPKSPPPPPPPPPRIEPVSEQPARRPRRRRLAVAAVVVIIAVVTSLIVVSLSDRSAEPAASDMPTGTEFTGDGMPPGWTANGYWSGPGGGHYARENVTFDNGRAIITGSPNGDTGHFWKSTETTSGRIEVRVRIPRGCACHRPVFSLWSEAQEQKAGEIVFLEVPGGDRQTLRFAIHHPTRPSITETRPVDLTVWNTVAVEWNREHVTGFLNGEPWFRTDQQVYIPTSPLRPTFKMDWAGGDQPTPSTMEIDWIRVTTP